MPSLILYLNLMLSNKLFLTEQETLINWIIQGSICKVCSLACRVTSRQSWKEDCMTEMHLLCIYVRGFQLDNTGPKVITYREVPWQEIFVEQELWFGLDLGWLAVLKKRVWADYEPFKGGFFMFSGAKKC